MHLKCTYNGNFGNETEPWCSTKVDDMGRHIENQGNWGYCGENCPLPGKYILNMHFLTEFSNFIVSRSKSKWYKAKKVQK